MDDFMRQDQSGPKSPSFFIAGLSPPQFQQHLLLQEQNKKAQDEACTHRMSLHSTNGSEKDEKRRLAGIKSRQKKKQYLSELQRSVRHLTDELEQTETEILKCKSSISETLRSQSSSHEPTMQQLQHLVTSEDPELDQVNLLLDVIHSRLGADANERLSTMKYYFKQIINSLFPALHRYLMQRAEYQKDVYSTDLVPEEWAQQLYLNMEITPEQHSKLLVNRESLTVKRREAIQHVTRLKQVQKELQKEAHTFEKAMIGIRGDLGPVRASHVILFGHKNKFRMEFAAPGEENEGLQGRKMVKKDGKQ